MSVRRIHCQKCGTKHFIPQHAEDVAQGWKLRVRHLNARKPAEHCLTITGGGEQQVINLLSLVCDSCNEPIPNGQPCVALTQWRDTEPPAWEQDYGTIV